MKASTDLEWLPLFEALASDVRLRIIQLLAEKPMNNKDLAESLGVSSAIVSMHVRKLQRANLIASQLIRRDGGTHKLNSLAVEAIQITLPSTAPQTRTFREVSIPIGHFTQVEAYPTCGLATTDHVIGQFDDPRYFFHPDRMNAAILWFGRGEIEYRVPNYTLPSEAVREIEISLEIGSEAPGVNRHWPSDIRFYLNGVDLGYWTSPGDSGDGRGVYTPEWWSTHVNQYGFLKVLRVTQDGTFIDGERISAVRLADLPMDRNQWTFRMAVLEDANHVGGLTLYGTGFGNYKQDILFRTYEA